MKNKNSFPIREIRKRKKWLKPEDIFYIGREALQEKVKEFLEAGGKIKKIESDCKLQKIDFPDGKKADSYLRNYDEIVKINCGVKHTLY